MRVLAACLAGFLGLGALATMAACSDSTDMGAAGSGGASAASGGSGGKASGGSTSTAGTGGGPGCTFLSTACNSCIQDNCSALLGACGSDTTCGDALNLLTVCACNPSKDATECQATFAMDGGDKAVKLIECYSLNHCDDVCQ